MKNILFIVVLLLSINISIAQTSKQYGIKIEGIYGNIIAHDKRVKELISGQVTGAELSIEFQTMGEKNWHQYNAFPIIGVGAAWLNLGNPHKLGNAFALYPYICFPLIRTKPFNLNLKAGAGASYITKTYQNTNSDSLGNKLPSLTGTNGAIGSALNAYFSAGASMEIAINKKLSLTAEYTWNHMSNGSTVEPNSGLNLLNRFIGLKYFPTYKNLQFRAPHSIEIIPRKYSFEIIMSGGFRQLYYKDNKTFLIASIALGVYRPITNFYRMGLGIDAFYDGAYNGKTQFERTYITDNALKNKIRIGTSWKHEILLGRLTAGLDFGLYIYDPLKNLSSYSKAKKSKLNKPLIYNYNIDSEDGWLYSRATLKYALSEHYFLSLGLKTHLQKAEFIEWGLGYIF